MADQDDLRAARHQQIETAYALSRPDAQAVAKIPGVSSLFRTLAHLIVDSSSPGREQSLALTQLETAHFWTIVAITHPDPASPPSKKGAPSS